MIPEEQFPVGKPVPRIDSFESVEPDGPELTDEEKAWPVVTLQARSDSFEVIRVTSSHATDVVIRVRCDSSATPTEVNAFVEQLRSAVEGIQASSAKQFPIEIIIPAPAG